MPPSFHVQSMLSLASQKLSDTVKLLRLSLSDPQAASLIRRVRASRLTYLEATALIELYEEVQQLEREGKEGILVEAGVALGGSSLVMAAAKESQRPFYMYDAFEMIPPPSGEDGADAHARYQEIVSGQADGIRGSEYYGYQNDLFNKVEETLREYGYAPEQQQIQMVKGFYEDTLNVEQPIALAHLDCDWYESVMTCLERIEPNLVQGGVLIIDDYSHWSGCRKAVDTYFQNRRDEYRFVAKSRLHIFRK